MTETTMTLAAARWIAALLQAHLGAGLVFGLAFVTLGVARVDPSTAGMPWTVRLLLLPGASLLWPLLLWRWWGCARPRQPVAEQP